MWGAGNMQPHMPQLMSMQQQQQQPQQQQGMPQQQFQMVMPTGTQGSGTEELQNWMPDPMMLRQILQQGAGKYRITVRPVESNDQGGMQQQQQQQQQFMLPVQQHLQFQQQQPQQQQSHQPQMVMQMPQGQMGHLPQMQYMQPVQTMLDAQGRTVLVQQMPMGMQQTASQQQQQQQQGFMPAGSHPMMMRMVPMDTANNDMVGAPVHIYHAGQAFAMPEPMRKRPRRRRQRDPLEPKPARYAWNFFFKEHYKKIRNKDRGGEHFDVQHAFTDIGASLGEKWKKLSAEERAPYIEMAEEDKLRRSREMKEYLRKLRHADSANSKSDSPSRGSKDDGENQKEEEEEEGEEEEEDSASPPAKRKKTPVSVDGDSGSDQGPSAAGGAVANKEAGEEEVAPEKEDKETVTVPTKAATAAEAVAQAREEEAEAFVQKVASEAQARADSGFELSADILVTDDDDAFIFMIKKSLHKIGLKDGVNLNIDVAKNGEEAITKIVDQRNRYSLVMMDKEMGESIDGVETVRRIRESGYDGQVVGVTGSDASVFDQSGADSALVKGPALSNQLYKLVIEKVGDIASVKSTSSEGKSARTKESKAADDGDKPAEKDAEKDAGAKPAK